MKLINKFVNSISATLSLPSATLPLPFFNILPLPFPGVFDRPAKINKPSLSFRSKHKLLRSKP